jgi:hypothetical protein
VYAHYATLELYAATTMKITWRTVKELHATLNGDEFLMWQGGYREQALSRRCTASASSARLYEHSHRS